MTKQKSIVIIICYFGKFPWYFNYFLHSCKYNPDVHFYIISDNDLSASFFPSNVFPVQKSFNEMKEITSAKLGFKVGLEHPYKFCDFRPALAYLFPEYIEGYDFWGYGDIDVIYGNIRNFITNELLTNYEVISIRHDYLSGAFSIFKNSIKINELFKRSKDYIKVFTDPKNYCFDETNSTIEVFAKGITVAKIERNIECMTSLVKRLHEEKIINAYFDFLVIEGLSGKIKWDHGVLTYNNTFEAILYHLIKLKQIYTPKKGAKKIPDTFYISTTRIYTR